MKNRKRKIYPIIILMATLLMGIGYASVNSVILGIKGIAKAVLQDGIYITEAKYIDDDASSSDGNIIINSVSKTIVNSKVLLDALDSSQTVRLEITVYNSNDEDYTFVGTFFDREFYDNENIAFELEGLQMGDIVPEGESKTFYVNFKCISSENIGANLNVLNSIIDYRFKPSSVKATLTGIEFNFLLKNSVYAPEGDPYEYYDADANRVADNTVKIIVFGKASDYLQEVSGLEAKPIDLYKFGSVSLYRKKLSDGMYKVYVLSDSGNFILDENAAWTFDKFFKLEEIINLHLVDTSKVVNMRDMFCDCAVLKRLDLSNFNTSKVTNMTGMFARTKKMDYFDLSSFDTSNVIEMKYMFLENNNVKRIYVSNKWNVTDKVAASNGVQVFNNCNNLVGGSGTAYNASNITYSMAVVDGTTPGYLTSTYSLATGINVNHAIKNKSESEIANWTSSSRFTDTSVTSITFGKMRDYDDVVSGYAGRAVDAHGSGVISVYRVPNGSKYNVYILANSGTFKANKNSAWFFDKLIMVKNINNLKLLNTASVTNMRDMFCDAQSVTSLDLSKFNTKKVTTFEGMFARTYHIVTLDLSSFYTTKITSVANMFHLGMNNNTHANYVDMAPKLKTIYVSTNWDISSLASTQVFANNVNLVGGNGTVFNSSKLTSVYARVDTNDAEGYFTLK